MVPETRHFLLKISNIMWSSDNFLLKNRIMNERFWLCLGLVWLNFCQFHENPTFVVKVLRWFIALWTLCWWHNNMKFPCVYDWNKVTFCRKITVRFLYRYCDPWPCFHVPNVVSWVLYNFISLFTSFWQHPIWNGWYGEASETPTLKTKVIWK